MINADNKSYIKVVADNIKYRVYSIFLSVLWKNYFYNLLDEIKD